MDDVVGVDGEGLGLGCWDMGGFRPGFVLGVIIGSLEGVQVGGAHTLALDVDVVLDDLGL